MASDDRDLCDTLADSRLSAETSRLSAETSRLSTETSRLSSGLVERLRAAVRLDEMRRGWLAEAIAEIERLRKIAERWEPRYADGAAIDDPKDVVVFQVFNGEVYEDRGALEWFDSDWCVSWGGPNYDAVQLSECYSTREAAEAAAREEVQP